MCTGIFLSNRVKINACRAVYVINTVALRFSHIFTMFSSLFVFLPCKFSSIHIYIYIYTRNNLYLFKMQSSWSAGYFYASRRSSSSSSSSIIYLLGLRAFLATNLEKFATRTFLFTRRKFNQQPIRLPIFQLCQLLLKEQFSSLRSQVFLH